MTDLYRIELEEFRDFGGTFLGSAQGKRVLSNLIKTFSYNKIERPLSAMDLAKLDGARDVIRYILGKIGYLEDPGKFVQALSMAIPTAPKPLDQTEADTE